MAKYVTKIEMSDDGDLIFMVPEDLFNDVNFIENELLEWTVENDGTISITKTGVIHNKKLGSGE